MGTRSRSSRRIVALAVGLLLAAMAAPALADGTETLGAPSIPVATGSGTVAAGIGLVAGPGTINVNVPGTVKQALLYWEGQSAGPSFDSQVTVNGVNVTGTVIGGPTQFFGNTYTTTLRADITGLGLVASGPNALLISDMNFSRFNNGAGVVVIYDDGTTAEITIRDGNDAAFHSFNSPLDTTVPQNYTFAAEPVDRSATMTIFASSVSEDPGVPGPRPTIIRVTTGGVTTDFNNQLDGVDGDQWDTLVVNVTIPAGASTLTIQALSADATGSGNVPASFVWNVGGLSVPVTPPPPPPGGGQGCTPGYWKQPHHFGSWTGYAPTDDYATTFGVNASFTLTLVEAAGQGGGGEKALGRHAVAALLNSASAGVDYEYTTAEVIALVQGAYVSGNFESAKDLLEGENEQGCPLGNSPLDNDDEVDVPSPGGPPSVPPGLAKKGKG